MNYRIAVLGLLEIFSALSIGVFILALTYKLVKWIGQRYHGIREQENLAYSIYTASILFSVGYLVSSVLQPLLSSFRLLSQSESEWLLVFKYLSQGAIYIGIAYFFAMIIGLLSSLLYARITPIKEFEEIRNNNIGVAIVVSVIIITLTMMCKSGVGLLIESIIPYPELPPN